MGSLSLILFSGDYDRAMAAFTIANGAAGAGDKVTVFFTFWGVSLLRKRKSAGKGILQTAFKKLMPCGPAELPLSRFNFAGLGPSLLRRLIRREKGQTLEDLLALAGQRGVEFVVCQASLALLGLTPQELVAFPRLRVGDVHDFLRTAKGSEVCLFI
ncbi:MAG: DsrE/DsrF/DrsH-like family protein [Bacillota bacterium]